MIICATRIAYVTKLVLYLVPHLCGDRACRRRRSVKPLTLAAGPDGDRRGGRAVVVGGGGDGIAVDGVGGVVVFS